MMRLTALIFVVAVGCGGAVNSKRAGESCVASSECGVGLLCDSSKHVCAGMGSPDGAATADDAPAGDDGPKVFMDAPVVQHDAFVPKDAPPDAFVPQDAPDAGP